MKRLILLSICFFLSNSFAQKEITGPIPNPSPGVLDGVVIPENIPTKKVVPYEYVREADMVWSKRVWRYIDLREKINHELYYPLDDINLLGEWKKNTTRWSLWTVIRTHVMTGDLTVYSPYNPDWEQWKDGDLFKYPVVPQPGENYYTDSLFRETMLYYLGRLEEDPNPIPLTDIYGYDSVNANGEMVYPPGDTTWFTSKDIVRYHLKEDWYFDKERSQLRPRILGICPVIYDRDLNSGAIIGYKELFWLYFPECRYVFQNYFTYNTKNDSRWMSFDDLFWKRKFDSHIYKENNVYDRAIEDYRQGVDALLEAEKIKNDIFILEHDVWSF